MPAWLLWRRITRTNEYNQARQEEEQRARILTAWLGSKAMGYALKANEDLVPTRKEATRKKPDWGKAERARKSQEEFMTAYGDAHRHPRMWEEWMGLNPIFEMPENAPAKRNTKEFREERRKQIQEMEARLIRDMHRIAEVHGNVRLDQMQPT